MNKRLLIVLISIIISLTNTSAFSNNYEKTDRIVKCYPSSISNPDQLVKLINRDFELPEDKARAVYTWIATNIDYDIKALKTGRKIIHYMYFSDAEKVYREQKIMEELVIRTLSEGVATCQGYSTLFKHLCDLIPLECVVITGISKTRKSDIGNISATNNHSWNAVKIDEGWKLIDVTWGAGYLNENSDKFIPAFNDNFFFASPARFYLNHYPDDQSGLISTMARETFVNLPLYYPGFNKSYIEVAEPETGIIKVSKKGYIDLSLKNITNESVSIKFDNEKNGVIVYPEIKDQYLYYEIPYKKNENTYMTVFINNASFVTLKIQRR